MATIDSTGKIVNDWHYRVLYQGSEVEILECKGLFKYRDRKKGQVSVNWMHDYEMFPESIVAMKRDSGWGYVNKKGKTILEFKYDECWNFKDGIALVRQGYAFNFIDKNGKTKSDWYNTIGEFSNNLAPVAKKNKWGYINQNGQLVIKLQYNFASKFSEGYAAVKKGRKFGYINTTGKKVIPMEFTAAGNFENGKAIVKKGKFHGYIDTAGNFYNQ